MLGAGSKGEGKGVEDRMELRKKIDWGTRQIAGPHRDSEESGKALGSSVLGE